jgi:hypothetical protein
VNRRYDTVIGAGGIFGFNEGKVLDFGHVVYDSIQLVHTQVTSIMSLESRCALIKGFGFIFHEP